MNELREWSVHNAFDVYIETLEGLDEDISSWMEETGVTNEAYAKKVAIDAEWEQWNMEADLDGWLENLVYDFDLEYDDLKSQASQLLSENVFRTLFFDTATKQIS